MSEVKLSMDGIRYIALFEKITGAGARDCYEDTENNRLLFVVKNGDMGGLAIGKGGEHINNVKKLLVSPLRSSNISDDPVIFIKMHFIQLS